MIAVYTPQRAERTNGDTFATRSHALGRIQTLPGIWATTSIGTAVILGHAQREILSKHGTPTITSPPVTQYRIFTRTLRRVGLALHPFRIGREGSIPICSRSGSARPAPAVSFPKPTRNMAMRTTILCGRKVLDPILPTPCAEQPGTSSWPEVMEPPERPRDGEQTSGRILAAAG